MINKILLIIEIIIGKLTKEVSGQNILPLSKKMRYW